MTRNKMNMRYKHDMFAIWSISARYEWGWPNEDGRKSIKCGCMSRDTTLDVYWHVNQVPMTSMA